jgi:hypothetical protein
MEQQYKTFRERHTSSSSSSLGTLVGVVFWALDATLSTIRSASAMCSPVPSVGVMVDSKSTTKLTIVSALLASPLSSLPKIFVGDNG